jgi:hypothetical protein
MNKTWTCKKCGRVWESLYDDPEVERVITRDAKVPLAADDPNMVNGHQGIPIRPTRCGGWQICDDPVDHDYKTVWCRPRVP